MTNINPNDGVNKINANIKKENNVNKKKEVVAQSKQIEASSLNALNSYGKASINFKGTTKKALPDEIVKIRQQKTKDFVSKLLLNDDEIIRGPYINTIKDDKCTRADIGIPIEGFKDLYNTRTKRVMVTFDQNNEIDKVFKLNSDTKEIDVYSPDGEITHHYTKEDYKALHYYKYHPDHLHHKLRENRQTIGGSFFDEVLNTIEHLDKLFADETKVFRTKENKTIYRALQEQLTQEDIATLTTIGATFTEKSFCSTTEELNTAKRFCCGNPILKINVPQNTKYIDVERLFNIDHTHWREQELLFDRNTQFIVRGFDPENNIIEVDLVQN